MNKATVKNAIQLGMLLTLMPLSEAFASDRIVSCYKRELYSINADGSDFKQLTNYKVPGHAPTCKSPSQTADQSQILWSYDPEFHGGMSMFTFSGENDKDVTRLTPRPRTKSAGAWEASVSPDGKYATFTANRSGHVQIYQVTIASKKVENISQSDTQASYARWSPDSRQIVYVSYDENDKGSLYVMKADGSNKQPLLHDSNDNQNPAWSPNGKTIAYTVNKNKKVEIWTYDLATKQKQLVTKDVERYSTVGWSKTSDKLVFMSKDDYLSIIDVDGTSQRKVSNKKGFYEPFWY